MKKGWRPTWYRALQPNWISPYQMYCNLITADGSIISARPSGTEPKIKFYCSVNGKLVNAAAYKETDKQLDAKIDGIIKDLGV